MTTQHTPGPWRYVQQGTQVWGRSVGGCRLEESEHLIADVRGWGHLQYLPDGAKVQDANGQLIAAAPNLLNAVRFLLSNPDNRISGADRDAAYAAIAKATGGNT